MPPAGLGLSQDRWLYLIALVALLIAIRVAANMLNGRTGRARVAIRDHPIAAAAMGIDTARYKTLAFGTSTLFTGVAGALSAIAVGYVLPESYSLFLSISFLVGSAVGGIRPSAEPSSADFSSSSCPTSPTTFPMPPLGRSTGSRCWCCMYTMPQGVAGSIKPWLARLAQWTAARGAAERQDQNDGEERHDCSSAGLQPDQHNAA